ncbi:MAG: LytR family transcriptional regulator [Conexibacter sp.]|nr:LytR family transcriptional regulator [Conexibacter sp.]
MTISRRVLIALPILFVAWIALLALVMRLGGDAPAALVLFPPASLFASLPPGTAITSRGPVSVTVKGGAGLVAALDGSTTSSSSGPAAPSTAPAAVPTGVARPLGSFTTAVLNGTPTPGLGRAVANALQERGAKIGDVTNAATHDATRTQVFYAPGRRVDAGTVAQAIGIRGTSALMPITRAQRVLAGDQAKVVVLVGSDQNTAPHG